MKKITLSLVLCACAFFVQAQSSITEKVDPKVAAMMKRFADNNKSVTAISGWRIQLMATTDRQKMEDAVRQFQNLYPNIAADWVHAKPYYKVRAGAFTSKRDAQKILYVIKNDYPTAYPIQDNEIKPVELLK